MSLYKRLELNDALMSESILFANERNLCIHVYFLG